jgi:hypothetical protein
LIRTQLALVPAPTLAGRAAPSLSAGIARLLDRGGFDSAALTASLFTRSGLGYAMADKCRLGLP